MQGDAWGNAEVEMKHVGSLDSLRANVRMLDFILRTQQTFECFGAKSNMHRT